MSVQPATYAEPAAIASADPEIALKYALQRIRGDRLELVEGAIEPVSVSWRHQYAASVLRRQLAPVVEQWDCILGSGDLDLPGTRNWYVPDLAVVPEKLAKGAHALRPEQTLLIVEITSGGSADTDRNVKRRRYGEYGAPLYLVVDRKDRVCTLYSRPGEMGYSRTDGPLPFGTAVPLPEPFGMELDTSVLK